MNLKKWLVATAGLFLISILDVIVATLIDGGNTEGIFFYLFIFLFVLTLVSAVITVFVGIKEILRKLKKQVTQNEHYERKENNHSADFVQCVEEDNHQMMRNDLEFIEKGNVTFVMKKTDDILYETIAKSYIAFDVETTGLYPEEDRIVEVGAVYFENGEVIKKYGTLVNPGIKISASATEVNNITNSMIANAPKEKQVYSELVEFLGDALLSNTVLCAHNASFDMKFLCNTLSRLGYSGVINCVDTLSLSRRLVKGLPDYKQNTIARHFSLKNQNAHRAEADAEICGKILWELIKIKKEDDEKERDELKRRKELSKPTNEEMKVCAYIQDCIVKRGGDTEWIRFYRNASKYIDVGYLYDFLKFKCSKNGKYVIMDRIVAKSLGCNVVPCTKSEGGEKLVRVYFENVFELDMLSNYIFEKYQDSRKSALEYFKDNPQDVDKYKKSLEISTQLSNSQVEELLKSYTI